MSLDFSFLQLAAFYTFPYHNHQGPHETTTTTAKGTSKNNRFNKQNKKLCTRITLFFTFLCLHCTTTTWNDQILGLLGNGNGKEINSTISVRTWARSPVFSTSQNPLLLSNRTNWDNREKGLNDAVFFSATFPWTSPLSDRKVPIAYRRRELSIRVKFSLWISKAER